MKPPSLPENRFVARPEYLIEFKRLLEETGEGFLLGDTCAIYGTGKTTLLARLYEDLRQEGNWTALWVALDAFSIYHSNARIQNPTSLEALAQNLLDYSSLLVELGEQMDTAAFSDLRATLETINVQAQERFAKETRVINVKGGDVLIQGQRWGKTLIEHTTIKTGDVTVLADDESKLRGAIELAQEQFTGAFLERMRAVSQNRRFVLFVDDFCWIIDQRIGDWFLKLIGRLDRTVAMVARTVTTQEELPSSHDRLTKLTLGPFSPEQVKEYLKKGLPMVELPESLSRQVYAFSKGHPLMVSLVAGLIQRLLPRGEKALLPLLKRLADQGESKSQESTSEMGSCLANPAENLEELTQRLDALLDEIRRDAGRKSPLLLIGFEIGAVARRFDRTLLTYLLTQQIRAESPRTDDSKTSALARERASRLMSRLRDYAFVQWFEPQRIQPYAQVHYLIRERLAERLRREDPERFESLHRDLTEYYEQQLDCDTLNVGTSDYARLHRIEDPSWQLSMTEWLYHLCQLKDRRKARVQFTKLYLQAFDWWGAYLPFRFCDDLLEVWECTQPDGDREFLRLFRTFQTCYPPGFDKYQKGDWDRVHEVLDSLIYELELDLPATQLSPDERYIRGQIEQFLGDADHYLATPDYAEARYHHEQALVYFEQGWYRMWAFSSLSQLSVDEKQFLLAIEEALKSHAMASEASSLKEQDHELLSKDWRIIADAHGELRDWKQAIGAYAKAIFHAYIFHCFPRAMDEYSYSWYHDTGRHVAKQLLGWWRQGKRDESVSACRCLREVWLRHVRRCEMLFAKEPAVLEELFSQGSLEELLAYFIPRIPGKEAIGKRDDLGISISLRLGKLLQEPDTFS